MLAYSGNPQPPSVGPARLARPVGPEPATKAHEGTPPYGTFARPPAAGAATTEAKIRAAFARDDPRYVGGHPFDMRNEQTGF